jgi:hypothetical protein
MIGTRITTGLLLAAGLLVPAFSARAGNTIQPDSRPDPISAQRAADLALDDNDDLYMVASRGGGGFRGGVSGHSFGGGFRGGFAGGFRGGFVAHRGFVGGVRSSFVAHRGFVGGFRGGFVAHRGFVGGFRGGFVGGFRGGFIGGFRGGFVGFRPWGFGWPYAWGYYGYPWGYYGYPWGFYSSFATPCVVSGVTVGVNTVPGIQGRIIQSGEVLPPPMTPVPRGGTYPYDGGPLNPVPMPSQEEGPADAPRGVIRPDPRVVAAVLSMSEGKGKWAYPAYGEQPRRTSFATDR